MGAVASTNIITDGLIGCWDAGNRRSYPVTGTTWTDIVGGNNATLTNTGGDGPNFNSAKGGCISFDGTNDYANIGDVDALTDPTTATASVWFRREGETGTYGGILAAQFRWGFIYFNSGDELKSYTWLCTAMDGYTVTAGWHQAVTTWTASGGSNSASFYVDGILISQGQICYSMDAASELEIGRSDTLSPSQYFEGDITAIHIYDRVLSAAEVKQNYEATKSRFAPRITKSGLVGNWDAGDPNSYSGGTSTCKDTANGTTATFTNWDAGEAHFNSANGGYWEFDGTDQYIQCSTDSILQPQSFSVEAWVNDDNVLRRPIAGWNAGSVTPSVWSQYKGSLRGPLLYMNSSDWRYFSTFDSVDEWHHFVFTYTYEDTTTGVLYIDGASIGVQSTADNNSKASTDTFRIGRANTYYYEGSIALVRMYDRPLSAAEVMDNFQKTRGRFGV